MRKEIAQHLDIDKKEIDKLFELGFIDATRVNAYLVFLEFCEIKKSNPKRSGESIRNELAVKHNASPSSIYKWCKIFL